MEPKNTYTTKKKNQMHHRILHKVLFFALLFCKYSLMEHYIFSSVVTLFAVPNMRFRNRKLLNFNNI